MKNSRTIKEIVRQFSTLNGASFVGIRNYTSKGTGEVSNHVVNANFNYSNAVKKDLGKLNNHTEADILAIANGGTFPESLVEQAIAKLTASFEKNLNPETKSNQSKGQTDAYMRINNCMKLHIESGQIHVFALGITKEVLVKGEYKVTKSRELTLAQNAVKKHFNFTTSKYRNFIVNEKQFCGVNLKGEKYSLA